MNKEDKEVVVEEVKEQAVEKEKAISHPKRGYFFPSHNIGFEATSLEEANKRLEEHLSNTSKKEKN